ncbi:MAG: DUF4404 family protein [Pseudomonadales bacterium]|nr:DUF4404 family protein [Pseudomonadales bacterium]
MDSASLQKLLNSISVELKAIGKDPNNIAALNTLEQHVKTALNNIEAEMSNDSSQSDKSPSDKSTSDNALLDVVTNFEGANPKLSALLNDLANTLTGLGI